jgi:hypothetical protein
MNYKTIFSDTFRLFRESKLLWVFGVFAIVSEIVYRVSKYSIEKHPTSLILYLLLLIALYFSFLAEASLIYSTNQLFSKQNPTFSEVWDFCKARGKRIVGFYFVSFPLVMFILFIPELVKMSEISTSLTRIVGTLAFFILTSLLTLGICTIVINNLGAGMALWTGLLMVFNNLLHVIVLNSFFLVLEMFLVWLMKTTLFEMFLYVPLTVTMTLAYRIFIAKASYPALSNIQPTA